MNKEKQFDIHWITISRPGYQGKSKDSQLATWDNEYGKNNWRLMWNLANGELLNFEDIFELYIESYLKHFQKNSDEAVYLSSNYSYTYDKDWITKNQAFDKYFLYNKPNRPNQFHHVALNLALEKRMGLAFVGRDPIQVREGKTGTNQNTWPAGWKWSPGRIRASRPELIPQSNKSEWWEIGSIEHLYQASKVLQIKK